MIPMKKVSNEPEPEAYKIGFVPFIHTEIYLDSKPLIPRPETEYWVDLVIKKIKESKIREPKILDLCAGSGCIGISVLKEIPEAFVDFVEIDKNHHSTIEKNIGVNKLDHSHTRIFGGNLFENIKDQYDFVLSNPPYINPELVDRVEESVMLYEPKIALFGGNDGLEVVNSILAEVGSYLRPEGSLYLEHEPEQVALLAQNPLYQESMKDQYGMLRFSRFTKTGHSATIF